MKACCIGILILLVMPLVSFGQQSDARREEEGERVCGTLDLSSRLTKHCFPKGAHRHNVCCVDIKLPGGGDKGQASNMSSSFNILEDRIRKASRPESFSWCACSRDVCIRQLGGRVAWTLEPSGSIVEPLSSQVAKGLGGLGGLVASKTVAAVGDARPAAGAAGEDRMSVDVGFGAVEGAGEQLRETYKGDESDEVIDMDEKLAPLSKDQLIEVVASLIGEDERLGDKVLKLARRPLDTSFVQHRVTGLHLARASAESYAHDLMPLAEQAMAYARAQDRKNAVALAEAMCSSLLQMMPRTDPQLALAPLLSQLETSFELSLAASKKRSELARMDALLKAWSNQLTARYGPIFSDAIRIIAKIQAKRPGVGRKAGAGGDVEMGRQGFFDRNRVSKAHASSKPGVRKSSRHA